MKWLTSLGLFLVLTLSLFWAAHLAFTHALPTR